MTKLGDNIDSGYFLRISYWVGLSAKPGSTGMFVYPDGKYIIQQIRTNIHLKKTEENKIEGRLSEEELQNVKDYIDKNITENSSRMIYDAGHSVEVFKDDKTIRIENDDIIYRKLSELLGFQEKLNQA